MNTGSKGIPAKTILFPPKRLTQIKFLEKNGVLQDLQHSVFAYYFLSFAV